MGPGSAEALVQQIIEQRIDSIVRRAAEASSVPVVLRSFEARSEVEQRQWDEEAREGNRRDFIQYHLFEAFRQAVACILREYPSLTHDEVADFIHKCLPPTRGSKANALFDGELVRAAHRALMEENPSWGSRAACETLAERLQVSPRTIEKYLAASKPPK